MDHCPVGRGVGPRCAIGGEGEPLAAAWAVWEGIDTQYIMGQQGLEKCYVVL